jgi:hypothetical protein
MSISVIGRHSVAHACAVDGVVFSAAHVVSPFVYGKDHPQWYTWSDGVRQGWFAHQHVSAARDLGVFFPKLGDLPRYHKIGDSPVTGDYVTWYEYNYTRGNVLEEVQRESKVERTVAGHIVISREPAEGSSGGCLFNAQDKVVGIITWSIEGSGVAVDLTGKWWPFSR